MKILNRDIFVLVIGMAGGGTTGVRGLINLSPHVNIGFEKKQGILRENEEIFKGRMGSIISVEQFNGNKIALNRNIFKIQRLIECIEKRKVIMHDDFLRLKIVFVERNSVDTVCSNHFRVINNGGVSEHKSLSEAIDNWFIRKNQIEILKKHFKEHISVDFYLFILKEKIQKEVFMYLEEEYLKRYFYSIIECNWYGKKLLRIENLTFNSLSEKNKFQGQIDEVKKEFIKKGISLR